MNIELDQSICILGRQPQLGIAELEALYGSPTVLPMHPVAALLSLPNGEIDFTRLGGSLKLGKVLSELPAKWDEIEKFLGEYLASQTPSNSPGKLTLGLSVYGMSVPASDIQRSLLTLKQKLRKDGRSVRIVPNRQPELNSAQVLHNKLTSASGMELLVVSDGQKTLLAQTVAIQDIEAYGARDQARPKRDARVGMLPPKLAQIIINLATGTLEKERRASLGGVQGEVEQRTEADQPSVEGVAKASTQQSSKSNNRVTGSASKQVDASRLVVLDPFCGTGVILQEALLMGYGVVGTDNDQRMIDYTNENIEWLQAMIPTASGKVQLSLADATEFTWPTNVDAVASETYLGRALPALPDPDKLHKITGDVNVILTKFLKNLAPQLKSGTQLCVAVPAWRSGQSFIKLPLIDHLTEMGYNYQEFQHAQSKDLIYWRDGQVVGRQLLVLTII